MCRRFIPIDCDEVARIAAEIERDLAAHADELASLDPIEAYEDFLFFPESAQPDRAEQRAKREEAPVQLSLFDGESDEPAEARGTGAIGRANRPEALPSSVVPLIVAAGDGCEGCRGYPIWPGDEVHGRNRLQPFPRASRRLCAARGGRVMEVVLRASSLPGACSGLLGIACDRDGAERAHRAPREAPVRLRSARRRAALAGGRARSRTILARHHRTERRRGSRAQPHAARAGTGRGRPMAARRLRAAARPRCRAADRASRALSRRKLRRRKGDDAGGDGADIPRHRDA